MTQRQGMPGEQPGQNIEQMQDMAMNVTYNFASVVVMPIEILLYPWFGTRYFLPPIFLLSAMMMAVASALFSVADSVGQMIPFVHVHGAAGIFGIASMTKLFFLASLIHGPRLWRRMLDMSREPNSLSEGPPLPFFRLLPLGSSFWFRRIVWEPLAILALSIVLANLFIIQAPLMLYLQIAAFMLALKQYVAYYKFWMVARNLMDMAYAGPIIARIVENKATDDDMMHVHLASLPKNLAPDIRKATVAHLARAFSAPQEETEKPPRNPEAGASGLKIIFLMLVIATFFFLVMCGVTIRQSITQFAHHSEAQEQSIAARPSIVRASGSQENAHAAQAAAFRSLSYLGGIWMGASGTSREDGLCNLKLEIRPRPESTFAGFATLTCVPLSQPRNTSAPLAILLQRIPRSVILTGIPGNGEVAFHVEKLIGFSAECPMTVLEVTPFGSSQLAAEWKNGACDGGQIVMSRAGQ